MRDFHSKTSLLLLLTGKLMRFFIFAMFLFYLVSGIDSLAGYNREQVIFIFLTFNFIDIVSQFLFREIYRFRPQIISGDFDLVMVKPMRPLFRAALGGADFIDFLTIPPLILAMLFYASKLDPTLASGLMYILLLFNGLVIAAAFHIFILAFAVVTLEIESVLWLFRELLNLGKVPLEVYRQPLRTALVYLVPVATMVAVPAKALMGFIDPKDIFISLVLGFVFMLLSFKFWEFALTRYTSASS